MVRKISKDILQRKNWLVIMLEWIEVNIGVNNNPEARNFVLVNFVAPLVRKRGRQDLRSWHFLWEGKPWPELKEVGITLRLRFYGKNGIIDQLKQQIDKKLTELEKSRSEFYFGHCFGEHGNCGKEYKGEAKGWGTKGWKLGVKMLEFGSETALELIKNKDKLGKSEEYKKPVNFYADRYVHCFLNQFTTLINEIDFYLNEAIQRISYTSTRKMFTEEELRNLTNDIRDKVVNKAKERLGT